MRVIYPPSRGLQTACQHKFGGFSVGFGDDGDDGGTIGGGLGPVFGDGIGFSDESGFSDGKEGMDAGEDGGALGDDAAEDSRCRSYDMVALSGFGKAKIADVDKVGLLLYPSLPLSRIQAARSVILIWPHKELTMQVSPNSFATLSLRKYKSFHSF